MVTVHEESGAVEQFPYSRPQGLPKFESPPVTEVRLGMVIQPLHIPVTELPDLFQILEDTYPVRSEGPPRSTEVMMERKLGPTGFRLELGDIPPIPLLRFESSDGSRWLEVQSDALTCGWRRSADGNYPAYEVLRSEFIRLTSSFASFWNENHVDDDLYIVQAGISYHNDFEVDAATATEGLARAFSLPCAPELRFEGLPSMDTAALNYSFNIEELDETYAILRVAGMVRQEDQSAHVRLNLRFWGNPFGITAEESALGQTLRFMDEGHRAIVTAFDQATSPEFHKIWGRYEEHDS